MSVEAAQAAEAGGEDGEAHGEQAPAAEAVGQRARGQDDEASARV